MGTTEDTMNDTPTKTSVYCSIRYKNLKNDSGNMQPSIILTCPECHHNTTAWGQAEPSIRRACWRMSQECECSDRDTKFFKVRDVDKQENPFGPASEDSDEIPF